MRVFEAFPVQHTNLQRYVTSITIPSLSATDEPNEEDEQLRQELDILPFGKAGNEDLFVRLKDGREYAFTAFTPENVKELMEHDGVQSFVSPGMLMVHVISVEALFEAIEECLKFANDGSFTFDHFGILQR